MYTGGDDRVWCRGEIDREFDDATETPELRNRNYNIMMNMSDKKWSIDASRTGAMKAD